MTDPLKTTTEIAKATQEVAKTAGEIVGATKKLCTFVAQYVSGPLAQISGIVEDKLAYMRWENQQALMQRASDKLASIGLQSPTRYVHPKFAIPLLQAASLEDNAELRELWANLLVNAANAASEINLRRAYITILERISPLEATILQQVYALPFDAARVLGVVTAYLPETATLMNAPMGKENLPEPSDMVKLSLSDLAQQGCIVLTPTWGGAEVFTRVTPTLLGKEFVSACTLQMKA